MVSGSTPFKPSPLSFSSSRASPFRRPSTPNSPPAASNRAATPGSSPSRAYTPVPSPSKLNQAYTVRDDESSTTSNEPIPTPTFREAPLSPTRGANAPSRLSPIGSNNSRMAVAASSDAASKLNQAQLREIREAFLVLDRDNDGAVNRDDVADVLMNLGQDTSTVSQFFPPGGPQTINFPTFLNTLSLLMAQLSPLQELLNALAAFDDDDSGQIDVAELRDALFHTAPEDGEAPLTEREIDEVLSGFTGRRTFGGKGAVSSGLGGSAKRGEVFRYHDLVNTIMGTAAGGSNGARRDTNAVKS